MDIEAKSTKTPFIFFTSEVIDAPSGILKVTSVVPPTAIPETEYVMVPVRSKSPAGRKPVRVGVISTSERTVEVSEIT